MARQSNQSSLVTILRVELEFPLSKMKPWDKNPRINDTVMEALDRSLSEFGAVEPIVLDENYRICAGHARWKAASSAGRKSFPAMICKFADERAFVAYNITSNRTAELSLWDPEKLQEALDALGEWGMSADELSFDDQALQNIMASLTDPDLGDGVDPDDVPPLPENPRTKPGDLWLLGSHRLYCGDATKPEDVQVAIGDYEPLIMVTDPPYGVNYDPTWRKAIGKGCRRTGLVNNDDRADWLEAYLNFPGDVAYVWHSALHASQVESDLLEADFLLRSQIIWSKQKFAISRGHYHWMHEPCWYCVRKGRTARWIGGRTQTTVWEISNLNRVEETDEDAGTNHSTQKPVECMARPMRHHGRVGSVVYDPFVGSGTTLIAAEMTKRICSALEIDPAYCDVVVERWENYTGQTAECHSSK